MAIVQIELPDELAQKAQSAGLLSPTAFEEMLREGLRVQSRDRLRAAVDSIAVTNDLPYTSPEEVAVMRAEKRAASKG